MHCKAGIETTSLCLGISFADFSTLREDFKSAQYSKNGALFRVAYLCSSQIQLQLSGCFSSYCSLLIVDFSRIISYKESIWKLCERNIRKSSNSRAQNWKEIFIQDLKNKINKPNRDGFRIQYNYKYQLSWKY